MWMGLFLVAMVGVAVCGSASEVAESKTVKALWIVGVGIFLALVVYIVLSAQSEERQEREHLIEKLSEVENLGVVDITALLSKGVYTSPDGKVFMWNDGVLLIGGAD